MTLRATYRLQFEAQFPFAQGARLAPYLAALGVSHVYASPIAEARTGSRHGYDVTDHARISEERGGADGFRVMAAALRAHGLGIVLDIVPNHMATGRENRWWMDVLKHGPASQYARHFDIDWQSEEAALKGKVLAPFLGVPYAEALRTGALALVFDVETRALMVAYFDHRFPLRDEDERALLAQDAAPDKRRLAQWSAPDALAGLLSRQHYALCWWREAGTRINWRRFFDVAELIALRAEEPEVFEAVHALPFALYAEGLIDGVRVDHVDGLACPETYCRKLRARFAALEAGRPRQNGEAIVVVEKILGADERLSTSWGVDGTTGYDFMAEVSAFQHAAEGEALLTHLWQAYAHDDRSFDEIEREARASVLEESFAADLSRCATGFLKSAGAELSPILPRDSVTRALAKMLVELRVYRDYGGGTPDARSAAARFRQLSAALAGKAVEDTAFYRYGRLLSRNEVGSDPRLFSLSPDTFHARAKQRREDFPRAFLATATHDAKRGEDARARLATLSEIPEIWGEAVAQWFSLLAPFRDGAVEDDTLYMLLQTIVGAWPLDLSPGDREGLGAFHARLARAFEKGLREAKRRTSWLAIDAAYERAAQDLLRALFAHAPLVQSLCAFVNRIAAAGAANGLVQTALRNTLPGVPDLYQGTEYWDFSLVDPDNRRQVDFALRARTLDGDPGAARASWRDGVLKQRLVRRVLALRRERPDLFAAGDYLPLAPLGARASHVFAFSRRAGAHALIVVAARHVADALKDCEALAPSAAWWGDTRIEGFERGKLRALFADRVLDAQSLRLSDVLGALPVELLVSP